MSMTRSTNKGFTLIEVLIALLVLAIGLLGMASLTMTSLQGNQSAYLRGQASLLAGDIIERMRGNSAQALLAQSPYLVSLTSGNQPSDPDCKGTNDGCTPSQQAAQDIHDWWLNLQASIPGASATISRAGTNQFQIVISWTESDSQQRATTTQAKDFTLRVNL
ncbi:type IV pilus modification protein PilV [Pseudomonas panipatensis]|uniref:Type IV pilus assembly protein PilV n=1 Tax=Pseudomonas panipatensis TaxID=428992 RepID=A0A1G8E917_9PSED|nr:type IV pilus modification protein PilV [Pseudomonas panipatensis]SDH66383.1 type IV pilus assembly protein PilV [Pseudomonas panipatensis]SMP37918.1 type IV pilus assembly protein PilV [Pseudomonas panipatensis]